MDNLFISAKFIRAAFSELKSRVMIHGVCRMKGRGLPSIVHQEDFTKDRPRANLHYGDVKAAVLQGDPKCPNLIAFSVYDAKPVYFLSTAAEKVCWEKNTRSVYDKTLRKKVKIHYYRSNIQIFYNFHMNYVDVADQLRGSYGFQHWVQNRKWWWALFMWGFGVILVNAYLCYKSAHLLIWCTDKKDILSQYEFRKSIVLSWMHDDGVVSVPRVPKNNGPSSLSAESASSASLATSRQKRINTQQNNKRKKAIRFNEKTLNPVTGSLKIRLDTSYSHLPKPNLDVIKKSSFRCQLHRFYNRSIEYTDRVMVCETCNVSLCLYCYKGFHTQKRVQDLRNWVFHVVNTFNHCANARATNE